MIYPRNDLAINSGFKAKTTDSFFAFIGGLEVAEAEKKYLMEFIGNKYLSMYSALGKFPSKGEELIKRLPDKFEFQHWTQYG